MRNILIWPTLLCIDKEAMWMQLLSTLSKKAEWSVLDATESKYVTGAWHQLRINCRDFLPLATPQADSSTCLFHQLLPYEATKNLLISDAGGIQIFSSQASDDLLLLATDLPYKKVCGATKSLLCPYLQSFPTMLSAGCSSQLSQGLGERRQGTLPQQMCIKSRWLFNNFVP